MVHPRSPRLRCSASDVRGSGATIEKPQEFAHLLEMRSRVERPGLLLGYFLRTPAQLASSAGRSGRFQFAGRSGRLQGSRVGLDASRRFPVDRPDGRHLSLARIDS